METTLRDEDRAGSLEGPVELLEARLDLPVQVADAFPEEASLLGGQHADDPVCTQRRVEGVKMQLLLPPRRGKEPNCDAFQALPSKYIMQQVAFRPDVAHFHKSLPSLVLAERGLLEIAQPLGALGFLKDNRQILPNPKP